MANIENPKNEQNFELVYLSGISSNLDILKDDELNFRVENSLKLMRNIEMF